MARIKIDDLPKDKKLSGKEIKAITGGFGPRGWGGLGFLPNPFVLTGIVAAAIAIPLAIANGDDEAS